MSVSQSATISQMSACFANWRMSYQACAPQPIAARRTLPFARYAFAEKHPGRSWTAPAAASDFKKCRLFITVP